MSLHASREIENGLTGERVRFVLTAEETGGELLVMENHWSRPDHRLPPHRHPQMEERWTVIEGQVAYVIGGEEHLVGPGESVIAPAGVTHWSRNAGDGPVLVRVEMRPACRWEEFLRQLFALASEGFEGETAQRSATELFTEFTPEVELIPEDGS